MGVVFDLLRDVPLPKMAVVRQIYHTEPITDIPAVITKQLSAPEIAGRIRSGMSIAITCGSRGVSNIALVIKTVAAFCLKQGAKPFCIPAMDSHGGVTAGP